MVFQDPYGSLSPRMLISEIIEEPLLINKLGTPESRREKVHEALKAVELDPAISNRYPHEFSGGQRQRIAIARALVVEPEVIIFDEPTSSLDRTVQQQVLSLLQTIQKQKQISFIFISHDLAVIRAISHRIMVIQHGQLIEQNDTIKLFSSPSSQYTENLINSAQV